jgi:hypothetical protein
VRLPLALREGDSEALAQRDAEALYAASLKR